MDILDEIKISLDSNKNLEDSIKDKLFELVIIFNKKLPDISLDKFNELAKTVKLGRISKFENLGTSFYNVKENTILFSPNRLRMDYDLDNLFMRAVLGMITSTGKYSGFNSEVDMYALNNAYEEILATYLVGNEEMSDQEEEMIITNLIGDVVGTDILFNAYFSNNGQMIKDAIKSIDESYSK